MIFSVAFLIVLIVGLRVANHDDLWKRALIAIIFLFGAFSLIQANGTLEDPSGDGLLTRWVRHATNDGPLVAIYGLIALAITYGFTIWLVYHGFQLGRQGRSEPSYAPNFRSIYLWAFIVVLVGLFSLQIVSASISFSSL